MNIQQKKKLATQIKIFFKLVLIAIGLNLLIFVVIAIGLKPPINPPISEAVKQDIRNSYYKGSSVIYTGLAFKTHSKYDEGMPFYTILDDNINEYRLRAYNNDLKEKMSEIGPLVFLIIVVGYYLLKGVNWVDKYSSEEEIEDSTTQEINKT